MEKKQKAEIKRERKAQRKEDADDPGIPLTPVVEVETPDELD